MMVNLPDGWHLSMTDYQCFTCGILAPISASCKILPLVSEEVLDPRQAYGGWFRTKWMEISGVPEPDL